MREMTNEELAKLYPVILSEYNSAWQQWFAEEKERLFQHIGVENIVRVTHIGSTAVPGLMAKPTIDILLEITDGVDVIAMIDSLPNDEYICLRKQTIPTSDLVLFLKGYTDAGFAEKVYHIHVRYPDDWDEVRFRDYLIAHPEAAKAYAALKRQLKEQFEFDRDGYTNAKGKFIKTVGESNLY
ncbi:MAG: GrpB family protein [Oscillospiraceae bacterium]|nr:GrpB family protein [Oscillospiraceae bacterium]